MRVPAKRMIWAVLGAGLAVGVAWPKLRPHLPTQSASAPAGERAQAARGPAAQVLRVTAVTVSPTRLEETVASTGSLRADEAVELQAEVNGKIVSINFREGAAVRRGDLLLKLNDADLHAQLTRAVFRRDLAQLKERRMFELSKGGNVRQEDYDASLNELNVQRAEVSLIEAQIAKTEIRAPFDGRVGLRFVSEGTFVTPTTRIATLQKLELVKLDFAVPEKYMNRIRPGRAARFTVAGSDQAYLGEIYAVDPRIDAATRTVLVRARCPNAGDRLLPGAFAQVEVAVEEIEHAFLVPSVAIVSGVSEKHVFVIENGKAARRTVQIGARTETQVHVLSGLKAGEKVITSGIQQLRAGLAVAVTAPEDAVAAAGKAATRAGMAN